MSVALQGVEGHGKVMAKVVTGGNTLCGAMSSMVQGSADGA
jgi:hypothetical protein